jgi:hypothetical protein
MGGCSSLSASAELVETPPLPAAGAPGNIVVCSSPGASAGLVETPPLPAAGAPGNIVV